MSFHIDTVGQMFTKWVPNLRGQAMIGWLCLVGSISCSQWRPSKGPAEQGTIPAHLQKGATSQDPLVRTTVTGGAQSVEEAISNQSGRSMKESGFAREEEIVWTNPDDPYAKLPELDELLSERDQKNDWELSYQKAKRRASREGKPLLLWFTNSANSPRCQALSREVLAKPEFESWAQNHIQRVRLDFNLQASNEEDRIKQGRYLEQLKKRYGVHGFPTIVLIGNDGKMLEKYRGFTAGNGDFYFNRMKNLVNIETKRRDQWRQQLEQQGYRTWQNQAKRQVFAKLLKVKDGTVYLVEPNGRRSQTKKTNLSAGDQSWLAQNQSIKP